MNSPVLPLLFSSTSRAILRFNCHYLRVIGAESIHHPISTPLGRLYQDFGTMVSRAFVKIDQIDRVLSQIDSSIKSAYQSAHISEVDRRIAETNMLISGVIPQVLMEPVKQLLTTTAEALKEEINVAELYLTDHGRLGLAGDAESTMQRSQHPIDTMQRIDLRKGLIRRCTRCCAITEDLHLRRFGQVVKIRLMQVCLCGSPWMTLGPNESSSITG